MSYYSDGNLARQVVRPQPYVLPEYDGREEERQRAERQARLQQEAASADNTRQPAVFTPGP